MRKCANKGARGDGTGGIGDRPARLCQACPSAVQRGLMTRASRRRSPRCAGKRFLGPGPWPMLHWRGYVTTPGDDPVYLYQDLLVGIIPECGLNNGRRHFTRC